MITVEIPALLRQYTHEQSSIGLALSPASTLFDAIQQLTNQYPPLNAYLLTADNQLASFVSFYINGKDSRSLAGEKTLLQDADIISIIIAIAGG